MSQEIDFDIERMEKLMEAKGLDTGPLAIKSKVSYDTVYSLRKYRRGEKTTAAIVAKLANGLGCSVEYLMGMTDDPTPVSKVQTDALAPLTSEAIQVGRVIDGLPDPLRTEAVAFVNGIQRISTEHQKSQRVQFENALNLIERMFGVDARRRFESAYRAQFRDILSGDQGEED